MPTQTIIHIILGQSSVAKTLASILDCPSAVRNPKDTGWNWPNARFQSTCRMLLVPDMNSNLSQVIRWHENAWCCPFAPELCCGVFGLREAAVHALAARDIFGRTEAEGETFDDWSN